MTALFRVLIVCCLLLGTACAMLPTHKDDLGKKNDDFLLRVRWLDFPGASLHFDAELRQEFVERFEETEDLKVTRFEATRLDAEIPQEKVAIRYLLEYYVLPSATVKKKRFSLVWEKQPSGVAGEENWRIMEPFPEIPGFSEKQSQ